MNRRSFLTAATAAVTQGPAVVKSVAVRAAPGIFGNALAGSVAKAVTDIDHNLERTSYSGEQDAETSSKGPSEPWAVRKFKQLKSWLAGDRDDYESANDLRARYKSRQRIAASHWDGMRSISSVSKMRLYARDGAALVREVEIAIVRSELETLQKKNKDVLDDWFKVQG